jgi:hypothetical protein
MDNNKDMFALMEDVEQMRSIVVPEHIALLKLHARLQVPAVHLLIV